MLAALLAMAVLLLALALWLARRGDQARRRSGLPRGRLTYADTASWSTVARPYFSQRYRLTGKPDYLVETTAGPVPIEVKNSEAPSSGMAYDSHVMQLVAYCLLVEEAHGQPPPHGLINYRDATIQIDYTAELRRELFRLLDAMRQDRSRRQVRRSHDEEARCRFCGVRYACGKESLF